MPNPRPAVYRWPGQSPPGFGLRINPISGIAEFHDGVDVASPCGSPVSSLGTGTVLFAGEAGGVWATRSKYGGTVTSYSHLSVIDVAVGDAIGAGAVVGLVGSTGFSTGCHLHYSVYRKHSLGGGAAAYWALARGWARS